MEKLLRKVSGSGKVDAMKGGWGEHQVMRITSPHETPFGNLGWFLRETFPSAVLTAAIKHLTKASAGAGGSTSSANGGGSKHALPCRTGCGDD